MAFSIGGLVGISHVPVQVLRCPPLDLFNQVKGLDDLELGRFSPFLMVLGSFLFSLFDQVLEVPDGRLVAVNGRVEPGLAQLPGDGPGALLLAEALLDNIDVRSKFFKCHNFT